MTPPQKRAWDASFGRPWPQKQDTIKLFVK
jgi:hypothetical protein